MSRGNRFYLRPSDAVACGVRLFAILLPLFTQCLLAQSNPTVAIDSPVGGAVVAGTMRVFGWAVDNASTIETGISGVPIQIKRADDGSVVFNGGAGYGLALYNLGYTNAYRPDVCNVYPNRVGCPYVGYQSDLDTTGQWGAGQGYFDVSVTATDSDQPVHHSITSTVRPYVEPLAAPTNLPVIPASGSTIQPTQLFTFSASSTNRPPGTDIYPLWVLFNNSVNGTAACYFSLAPSSGAVALVNDAGNAWGPSVAIGYTPNGAIPPISNSQCRLNLANSWFTIDPVTHNVALNMSITFLSAAWQNTTKSAFQLSFQGVTGANTGWQQMGTWTIPGAQQYYLTTGVSPSGGGTISPSSGWYPSGTVVQVSAGAASGYVFSGFSGALSGTTTPQSLTISGPTSVTANFTAIPPPATPTLISPASGSSNVPTPVTVTWNASTGATSYDLYLGTSSPPAFFTSTTSTSYALGSVSAATKYYWNVVARNAGGSSPASATWNFTTSASSQGGLYPSRVEINLGPFPVDRYFDTNDSGHGPILSGCSQFVTVRACVQQLFSTAPNNWRSQGVTGVRFFFTLAGGFYSTPFDGAGNVQSVWTNKLYTFFSDLRAYGIQEVTPTPVFDVGLAQAGSYQGL